VKRALFVAIPLMVALASIVTVSTAILSFPAGAQQALDAYLQYARAAAPPGERQTLRADLIVRASRPWALGPELGLPAFGDSWYFHADDRYSEPTPPATPFWQKYFAYSSESDPLDDRLALPFPPEEVWCVLLKGQPRDRVVLVARHHREPYYTEWITHQGPGEPFDQPVLETLSALGCDLAIAP
jgi:hypothetical protein